MPETGGWGGMTRGMKQYYGVTEVPYLNCGVGLRTVFICQNLQNTRQQAQNGVACGNQNLITLSALPEI